MENTKSWVRKNFKRFDDRGAKKVPPPDAISRKYLNDRELGICDDGGRKKIVTTIENDVYTIPFINRDGCSYVQNIYHVFGGFQDETETLSIDADTWTHITNAGNNLWTAMEANGFKFLDDELVVVNAGSYNGVMSITFEGGLTFDFLFRVYNVTQSVQSGYYIGETGRGVDNYANVCVPIYLEANRGDHFQFQVYEVSGNDAIFYNAIFNIAYLHE